MKPTKPKDKLKHTDHISWPIENASRLGKASMYILFNRMLKKVYICTGLFEAYKASNEGDILLYSSYSNEYFTFVVTESGEWSIRQHPICNLPASIRQWRLLHNT